MLTLCEIKMYVTNYMPISMTYFPLNIFIYEEITV